jgi:hypothetical protein
MKHHTSLIITVLIVSAFTGCSKHSSATMAPKATNLGVVKISSGTPITKQSAIQISNHFAEYLGYHLSDFYEPKVQGPADYYRPQFQEQAIGVYWIRYEPRVPMLKTNMYGVWATNCLDIVIDAKTGAAKKAVVRAREEIIG